MTTCHTCRMRVVPTTRGESLLSGVPVWVCRNCGTEGDYFEVAREDAARERDQDIEDQRRMRDCPPRRPEPRL